MENGLPDGAGPRPGRVLIVFGGDQIYKSSTPGRLKFVGMSDVDGLIPESVPTERLNLGFELEPMLRTSKQEGGDRDLAAFDCVLNLVSEADHSPKTLEAMQLMLRGYHGRVINRPEAVLRTGRDEVANLLADIAGLMVPRAVRLRGGDPDAAFAAVTGAGLAFPLIVRRAATHRGRTMVVVEDEGQFRSAVAGEGGYYAIEFVDYRSADGLFRKYRIWSFGGRQVFRHLATTDDWNVHIAQGNAFMLDRPDLIDEEVRLMGRLEGDFPDQVHAIVAEIGKRLGLECFGVDFGFHPDGRMVFFEANAAMSFFPLVHLPQYEYRGELLEPAREAFMAMLAAPAPQAATVAPHEPPPEAATAPLRGPVLIVYGGDHTYPGKSSGRVRFPGISDVDGLLAKSVQVSRLNLGKDLGAALPLLRQRGGGGDFSAFGCVLNLVTDADRSPDTLEALQLLLRGYRGRVINPPEAVLRSTREQVAAILTGIPGLLVPAVRRLRGGDLDAASEAVAAAGMAFPLIVRRTGTHAGRTMDVVQDDGQLRSAIADGAEYFATEFVDYRSADGLYRKYRIWSFGGRQCFRHLATTDHWNVHVTPGNEFMFDRPDLIDEEVRLMERREGAFPEEVHAIVAAIGERLGLDYFGVDFGFHPDGRMILFEANATMTFFPMVPDPRFEFRRQLLAPAEEAFMAMLGLQQSGLDAKLQA